MNATDCFALTPMVVLSIDGTTWVLFRDRSLPGFAEAVRLGDYQSVSVEFHAVPEGDDLSVYEIAAAQRRNAERYDRWLASVGTADLATLAEIQRRTVGYGIPAGFPSRQGWVQHEG